MVKEDQLIERIRRRFLTDVKPGATRLRLGIGDDAAIIRASGPADWVVTTDAFLENVHFLRRVHPAHAVGYKALARATSDLAAMGARCRYFLLTLALPIGYTTSWLDGFLDGMALAAGQFGLTLAGGDTTKYPLIAISLTVLGQIEPRQAILRSGARPGDLICVSGILGEAELGLRFVQRRLHTKGAWKMLTKKHFYPQPRLGLGQWLVARRYATAMIDTSDGFSTDLGHICRASRVGARVWAEKIPKVKMTPVLKRLNLDPLQMALNGGEDYELLFTVPERLGPRLPTEVDGVVITVVGQITRGSAITITDSRGRSMPLPTGGWDPFRRGTKER